jgi:hypothetical protein
MTMTTYDNHFPYSPMITLLKSSHDFRKKSVNIRHIGETVVIGCHIATIVMIYSHVFSTT